MEPALRIIAGGKGKRKGGHLPWEVVALWLAELYAAIIRQRQQERQQERQQQGTQRPSHPRPRQGCSG